MLKEIELSTFILLNERSQPLLHVRRLNLDISKKIAFLGLLKVCKIWIFSLQELFLLLPENEYANAVCECPVLPVCVYKCSMRMSCLGKSWTSKKKTLVPNPGLKKKPGLVFFLLSFFRYFWIVEGLRPPDSGVHLLTFRCTTRYLV